MADNTKHDMREGRLGKDMFDEKVKILCVDDEQNVLNSLKRLFFDDDFEILTALSGEDGLKVLDGTGTIQIVIADYRMPIMNGVDFLKKVHEKWPKTIRIVLSGYADAGAVISAINEGQIYKFIAKPWNDDELKVNINHAIKTYFLQKTNSELTKILQKKNMELLKLNEKLARLLNERTTESLSVKKLLVHSQDIFQDIFNSLPIGLLGIDSDGTIVQCNQKALKMLEIKHTDIMWMARSEVLPPEVDRFVNMVIENDALTGSVKINNQDINIKGFIMKRLEGLTGIVLVFGWEN